MTASYYIVSPEMAIGAGGLIKQSIHHDPYSPDSWDPSSTIVFNVQILNAKIFEAVTGKAVYKPPPDWKAYKNSGGKFFDIPEAPSSVSGKFKGVKSVGKLGNEDDNFSYDQFGGVCSISSGIGVYDHLDSDLREFRTAKNIEDEIAGSNFVSW